MNIDVVKKALIDQHKMECRLFPLNQDVTFFGNELECYKMAYKFKNKENEVAYSENLKTWYVVFPEWMSIDFSQNLVN